MNAQNHIGESAALYALGLLDNEERRAIDEHAATCDECARALGDAESDVAAMVTAQAEEPPLGEVVPFPQRAARRPLWRSAAALAVAAAFVIGFLPSAYLWRENAAMQAEMNDGTAAMNRLSSSAYRQVAFKPMSMTPGSTANVMYGPDGSWYVVVVHGVSRALQVAWMHDGQRTMLGPAAPYGDVAMLYLPKSHRMDQLALMDGDTVVAEAQLAY